MSTEYVEWSDVKAKPARSIPVATPNANSLLPRHVSAAKAYVRGHQLAEMRKAAGLTQAELAANLGVSQASAQAALGSPRSNTEKCQVSN
jgi:DNA-binding transcriptional regulator YiaG